MYRKIRRQDQPKILLLSGITAISVLFTVYSDAISSYAVNALRLCASSVIPSLFPFMILSAIASRTAAYLADDGSSKSAVILSVFLGALCGFPVGAASVAAMHKSGLFRKYDAEHLCALCNNAGPAFVIGVIGHCFWENGMIGIMFYTCQFISAGIVFLIWRTVFYRRQNVSLPVFVNKNSHTRVSVKNQFSANAFERAAHVFCTSVSESAISVIQICGYIVFFRVICDTLHMFMPKSPISEIVYTVVAAILEFTTGSASAAELGGMLGVSICGFTIGFSGLSVMAQSTGILSKSGLSPVPLIVMKTFSGFVSAGLSALCYCTFDFTYSVSVGNIEIGYDSIKLISVVLVIIAVIVRIWILFCQRKR